jgi:DNA-nicking Smr family endonuclease
MAKLTDLKALLDAAHAKGARAGAPRSPAGEVAPKRSPLPDESAAARSVASQPRMGAAKHAEGDLDLGRAFADVAPMAPRNKAEPSRPRPRPIARQRIDDERDALQASKYGAEPSPQDWDIGQEQEPGQTFLRQGLGTDVLTRLRRGRWAVQGEIDLHGMTVDEAHDALADFLLDARSHGWRCVRIIHGKGLTSPNREPVLKGKVRGWLSHWDEVLAYCEAPQHAGGSGAVVTLLRGRGR